MSTPRLNRNKMTNNHLGSPSLASSILNKAPVTPANSASKKLRTELRRVMSDRVLRITRCSQQQTVEKIKQKTFAANDLDNSLLQQSINDTTLIHNQSTNTTTTGTSSTSNLQISLNFNNALNLNSNEENQNNKIYNTPSK